MDAFGFVYPQYWLTSEADDNFEKHLSIIKEYYGHTKKFDNQSKGIKEVGTSTTKTKEVAPILDIQKLDEQALMFKITMKGNCHSAMTGDLPLNPLTCLWRRVEALGLLRCKLSEFLKVVELAIVVVLGSIEDERNKLRNCLFAHLPIVVGMHGQQFYTIEDFPYDAAYDEWQ
jgi:hypothetical protein